MKEQSVAKGFAVLSFAGVIVKLLSLLYIPFLLVIIGDEGNGIYAAAYQVYVLLYAISNSGIPVATSKLVSELTAVGNDKDALRSFKIARFLLLILGVVMAGIMLFWAYPLSRAVHYEKSYLAILALSPAFLFTSVSSAYRGYFQGNGNMLPTAISQVIEQIINTILTLVFAAVFLRYGIEAACAGGTLGTTIGALFSAVFLVIFYNKTRNKTLPPIVKNKEIKRYSYSMLVKKIVSYSIPITMSIGLQYTGNLIDLWNTKVRLLSAGFTDVNATQMYSYLYKYQQLLNAPIAIVAALAATILPAISAAIALRERDKLQNRVFFAYRICFLVTIPSAVGFSVLSDPLYQLLQYGQGSYLMLYGSVALILLAIVQIQTSILQGSGKFYPLTINLVLGIIGKIITNYFFIAIPQININGAIIGSIVSYIIPIMLNTMLIRRTLKIKTSQFKILGKIIFSSIMMGGIVLIVSRMFSSFGSTYIINAMGTFVSIMIGVISYILILIALKGLSNEDLEVIPRRFVERIPSFLRRRII